MVNGDKEERGKSMERKVKEVRGIGFVACYNGKTIASAENFEILAKNAEVSALLGKKGLVIRHTVPEGMLAVY